MPNTHAKVLQPSSMDRIIHCTPSALINARAPSKDTEYTREGTCAHSVCEWLLRTALGEKCDDPREGLEYYDESMLFCAEGYRDFCMEALSQAGEGAKLLVEQRVDITKWAEGCFGTADAVIVSDKILWVIDFKYGQGVLVEAKENYQLMCYGLGAVAALGDIYDFEKVRLSIYQPRRSSVDSWDTTRTELLKWADEVLAPAAKEALDGSGPYACGKWCKFCAISGECREQAKEMALDYEEPATLDPSEIAELLPKLDELEAWIKAVRSLALERALDGTKYPGFKVVAGRGRRVFSDEDGAAAAIEKAGYEPWEKKLRTITALEKEMGKGPFQKVVGQYIEKKDGSPTLVPESDSRPEYVEGGAGDYE